MTYQEAVDLVKTQFHTRRGSDHNEVIRTGKTYDGCKGFCINVYNADGEGILSDLGETKEVFDEVSEEEWISLCQENGFIFRHWRIERELNSIDDVYAFIDFLDMVSDKYCDLDD